MVVGSWSRRRTLSERVLDRAGREEEESGLVLLGTGGAEMGDAYVCREKTDAWEIDAGSVADGSGGREYFGRKKASFGNSSERCS